VAAAAGVRLLGAGAMGRRHARALDARADARLAGVVDTNAARAAALAAPSGALAARDASELFARSDAVIVATPPGSHPRVAGGALAAGKAVLVEKPVALTARLARELIELAERCDAIVRVGHSERFCPALSVASARLERAQEVRTQRYARSRAANSASNPVFDLMIHDIDFMLRHVREEVVEIRASWLEEPGVDRGVLAQVCFRDGRRVELRAGYVEHAVRRRIVARDDREEIEVDGLARTVVRRIARDSETMFEPRDEHETDVLRREHDDFLWAIAGRSPRRDGVEDAVRAVECAERITRLLS